MAAEPDISVVVPLCNEEASLPELTEWITRVVQNSNLSCEIILVDDGSTDGSWAQVGRLAAGNPMIRGIRFRRNFGKSAALHSGFATATGRVVITMDADLQDSPDEIPGLYRMITEEGYDIVSGWKRKRYDPIMKTVPSKFFNYITRKMSGIELHDFNCGLKAYKGAVVRNIEVYGEMHRYIPLIAKWAGFRKIGEKEVQHRKRKYGRTKFGMSRFINGFLDLLSISFVTRFGKKPMHLFGTLGTLSFFAGFAIALYLSVAKFLWREYNMTDRPLFYLGLLAMIIGSQLFMTGFLAEMASRNSPDRNRYLVEGTVGFARQQDG